MLSKIERSIMQIVYFKAIEGNGNCILKPNDILSEIPYKYDFSKDDLVVSLEALALDGYFEFVNTDKKGEEVYYFNLEQKGLGFPREIEKEKRLKKFKISLACTTASIGMLTFIIKMIINAVTG